MSWANIQSEDKLEVFYKSVLPAIRKVAKDNGYAIGLHGSMRRDLDLIAVPWSETFTTKDQLAGAIQMAACGFKNTVYTWEEKPLGRQATAFPICWIDYKSFGEIPPSLGHIDLSVIEMRKRE